MFNNLLKLLWLILIANMRPVYSEDRFSLPTNKKPMVFCEETALTLHPGSINSERTIKTKSGGVQIHFEIYDKNKVFWLVTCDGLTGKIIKDVRLNDEK